MATIVLAEVIRRSRRHSVRRGAAILSLLVLAATLARSFEPYRTLFRAQRLAAALRGEALPQSTTAGFWFDPDYAAFLAEVRSLTPENATIAVLVPKRPDMYGHQAYYQLAPRRVVEEKWMDEASFVATYRTELARSPGGRAIANGQLWAR
jgi:hypothetical protein